MAEAQTTEAKAFADLLLSDPTYGPDMSRDTLRALLAYAYSHGACVAALEIAERVGDAAKASA